MKKVLPASARSSVVLVALGSNRAHGRHGPPARVVAAAIAAIAALGMRVLRQSAIRATAAIGPGGRGYANAAIAIDGVVDLPTLLRQLKAIERDFGRRGGQRWGARVLDLDIVGAGAAVLPSRLRWRRARHGLIVPHPRMADRRFVLDPLRDIAPCWRHPVLLLTVRQMHARRARPRRAR
jgi:2-amino-4-hydroxy-6-hydroxymethyldihydropteridine diphosphokinase